MKVHLNRIEESNLRNFKGGELSYNARIFDDGLNKIMLGLLVPGASIGLHAHEDSSEVIFVISGQGVCICDGVEENLEAGDCHYCPRRSSHTLINNGDAELRFFAVVPKQVMRRD